MSARLWRAQANILLGTCSFGQMAGEFGGSRSLWQCSLYPTPAVRPKACVQRAGLGLRGRWCSCLMSPHCLPQASLVLWWVAGACPESGPAVADSWEAASGCSGVRGALALLFAGGGHMHALGRVAVKGLVLCCHNKDWGPAIHPEVPGFNLFCMCQF